jgi:hypothetical protein
MSCEGELTSLFEDNSERGDEDDEEVVSRCKRDRADSMTNSSYTDNVGGEMDEDSSTNRSFSISGSSYTGELHTREEFDDDEEDQYDSIADNDDDDDDMDFRADVN